jgi:hypothetical protein
MESGWRRRRHDECKVLVLFVVLLSFSFSLLRGKSDRLLVLWTGLPPFFFLGCSASWEHIGTGPCLVRDIWISIIEAQIVVLVLDRNSIKRPRSTLRSRR